MRGQAGVCCSGTRGMPCFAMLLQPVIEEPLHTRCSSLVCVADIVAPVLIRTSLAASLKHTLVCTA